jgi:quercetin dioxygenase-like cupin family protein
MSQYAQDPTGVITSHDRDWIPWAAVEGVWFKVVVADEKLKQVVIMFRLDPGTVLPPHTHKCHAIAYTISGEWEYGGLKLPQGAVAYEPVESTHAPSSDKGAELIVFLNSQTDEFLINHMPDGSHQRIDMAFFKALENITLERARS